MRNRNTNPKIISIKQSTQTKIKISGLIPDGLTGWNGSIKTTCDRIELVAKGELIEIQGSAYKGSTKPGTKYQ